MNALSLLAFGRLIYAANAFLDIASDELTNKCSEDPCPVCTFATDLQLAIADAKDELNALLDI